MAPDGRGTRETKPAPDSSVFTAAVVLHCHGGGFWEETTNAIIRVEGRAWIRTTRLRVCCPVFRRENFRPMFGGCQVAPVAFVSVK